MTNFLLNKNNVLHYTIQDSFHFKLYINMYSKSEKMKCISLLGI